MYERMFQLQEETLKTLANQKRLEIVQLLHGRELSVSEMVDMLGIPQANLSQHLATLRKLKLVETRKDGLHVYYRLSDPKLATIIRELRQFLKVQYAHEPEVAQLSSLDSDGIYPLVKDPVCGMRMGAGEASELVVMDGEQYHFCASGCKAKFLAKPSKYTLNKEGSK